MIKKILENKYENLKLTTLGFTLIELLAVIVILAIIALIATPIVLNIIEDSKISGKKRSIDNYANAVKYAVANSQLSNTTGKIEGTFTTEDGKTLTGTTILSVDYDGDVVCDTVEVYSDGSVYLGDCKVDGESIDYTYGTFKGVPKPVSFADDSWETIVKAVQEENISAYKVGDTKEIELTGFTNGEENSKGLYTVRIANTSTPDECKTEGFSQTACGFVIEFEDVITRRKMNSTKTAVGGWEKSELREYITLVEDKPDSGIIYNALPDKLKEKIIDTHVVSGHSKQSGQTNFTTTDKLYLLSATEIWGSERVEYDTAEAQTRQLDYYQNARPIKQNNGWDEFWWLRNACYWHTADFGRVGNHGEIFDWDANQTSGVAPAFRIG